MILLVVFLLAIFILTCMVNQCQFLMGCCYDFGQLNAIRKKQYYIGVEKHEDTKENNTNDLGSTQINDKDKTDAKEGE